MWWNWINACPCDIINSGCDEKACAVLIQGTEWYCGNVALAATQRATSCLKMGRPWARWGGLGGPPGSTANPPQTKLNWGTPRNMDQFARITCLNMWDSCPCLFYTCSHSRSTPLVSAACTLFISSFLLWNVEEVMLLLPCALGLACNWPSSLGFCVLLTSSYLSPGTRTCLQ